MPFYLQSEKKFIGECKIPYKWKKTSSWIKQWEVSSVYSTGGEQQRGKELYAARQRPWGSAGCSRDGAKGVTGQQHCCPALYVSPSQKLSQLFQGK